MNKLWILFPAKGERRIWDTIIWCVTYNRTRNNGRICHSWNIKRGRMQCTD